MTLCLWIIRRTNTRKSLAVLTCACALAAAGTLLPGSIGLFISFSIGLYACYSISIPVLQDIVASQAEPGQKNLVMGFYNATKSLGSIAGSLMAGFLYGIHVRLPFVCIALVYGLSVAAALGYLQLRKKASV